MNHQPQSFEHLKSSFKYTNLWWHLIYTIWVSQITYSSHLFWTFAPQKSWILQLPAVVSSKLNFPPAFTKHAVDTIRLAAVASCEALKPQSTMTGLFPPGRLRCRNDTKKFIPKQLAYQKNMPRKVGWDVWRQKRFPLCNRVFLLLFDPVSWCSWFSSWMVRRQFGMRVLAVHIWLAGGKFI